ncbi:MAG: hypothetical protein AAGC53_02800 [Actinomycetota bacterium]
MSDDLTISEVRALLGSTRRDARWHLTDELDILCLFARSSFDLRKVETTGNDVVEVTVTCAFGSVDFIVPDGTIVVLDGTSFLASANSDVAAEGDSPLPRIEITATTVLGRVKIVSPSNDIKKTKAKKKTKTTREIVRVPVQSDDEPVDETPTPQPAPAPVEEPVEPTPPPASFTAPQTPTAAAPVVPKPPPSKYAVADDAEDGPATAPAPAPMAVPPQNKYAVPAEEPAEAPAEA